MSPDPSTSPPSAGAESVAQTAPWRRMWLAVLLAFALIAASAGLQVWQTQRLVRTRQLDAPLIEAAGG